MKRYAQDEKGTTYNICTEQDVDLLLTKKHTIHNGKFVGNPNIINLVIPKNVVNIGAYAFLNCPNLWRVKIEGAEIIQKDAFKGCKNLKLASVSSETKVIGKQAFCNTGLTSFNIPENTFVEQYAFEKSGLQYVNIPNIDNLEHGVFHDCEELFNVNIEAGEVIRQWTFHGCKNLTTIKLPASITEIKNNAFTDTGLTRVEVPNSAIIDEMAFDPHVEIVRYERTDEHLLMIMYRNFMMNKHYSHKEKKHAESLINKILNNERMIHEDLFEDDMK